MERQYILPATFALTLQAFLLFGLSGKRPMITSPSGEERKPEKEGKLDDMQKLLVESNDPVRVNEDSESSDRTDRTGKTAPHPVDIPIVNPSPGVVTIPVIPAIPGDPGIKTIPVDWVIQRIAKNPSTGVVDWNKLDRVPRVRLQPAPVYPPAMRHLGAEGMAMVDFLVDETGNVYSPAILSVTTPGFEEAALRAVARWKFEPGCKNGRRVRFRMRVPLVFRMSAD
jgi:TonB family protein